MAIRHVWLVLVSIAGFGGAMIVPVDAAAFTCPDSTASDPPETVPALSDWYSGATDLTASHRLGELMTELRKSGMKPALIVDHLVGAYCPLVAADDTLSEKQKADRVRRFAQQVTGLAYRPSDADEVDVLVTVPVTPTLLGQVDQAAGRAGMSREAWLEQAIKQQLARP